MWQVVFGGNWPLADVLFLPRGLDDSAFSVEVYEEINRRREGAELAQERRHLTAVVSLVIREVKKRLTERVGL